MDDAVNISKTKGLSVSAVIPTPLNIIGELTIEGSITEDLMRLWGSAKIVVC